MSYTQLFFNGISDLTNYTTDGLNPHFTCPRCKTAFEPKAKPVPTLTANLDFNQKVTFTCPNCNAQITLFVAIHKDTNGLAFCLQKSSEEGANGISVNWWRRMLRV